MNNKAVIYQGKAIKLEMYETLKYYTTVHTDLLIVLGLGCNTSLDGQ